MGTISPLELLLTLAVLWLLTRPAAAAPEAPTRPRWSGPVRHAERH